MLCRKDPQTISSTTHLAVTAPPAQQSALATLALACAATNGIVSQRRGGALLTS